MLGGVLRVCYEMALWDKGRVRVLALGFASDLDFKDELN